MRVVSALAAAAEEVAVAIEEATVVAFIAAAAASLAAVMASLHELCRAPSPASAASTLSVSRLPPPPGCRW